MNQMNQMPEPEPEPSDENPVAETLQPEPAACYAGLPAATIDSLEQRVWRIKGTIARSALDIGQELAEAKKEIAPFKSGGFRAWVSEKVGITEQYAYQLIAVYDQFGGMSHPQF